MFFAIDETKEHPHKIFGGILIPNNELPNLEKEFTSLRLKHKLFGELGWSAIGHYCDRYCEFADLFFDNPNSSFHSICYRDESTRYRAAYYLIRTVTWKLLTAGIREPLWVLFDNDGSEGAIEVERIKEIAANDRKFNYKVEFCNQGASHVLGALQLSDLILGALSYDVNQIPITDRYQKKFAQHLENRNGLKLGFKTLAMPKLFDRKIQYFDPSDKPN